MQTHVFVSREKVLSARVRAPASARKWREVGINFLRMGRKFCIRVIFRGKSSSERAARVSFTRRKDHPSIPT